jgi:hypothetical protein
MRIDIGLKDGETLKRAFASLAQQSIIDDVVETRDLVVQKLKFHAKLCLRSRGMPYHTTHHESAAIDRRSLDKFYLPSTGS